jgi:hypothetical protein
MATPVDICNMALSLLGTIQISAFTDPSTEAQQCNFWYPFLRDAVLEDRAWTFATQRTLLVATPPLGGSLPVGWGQCFAKPVGALNIIQCYRGNTTSQIANYPQRQFDGRYFQIDWELLQNQIFTNNAITQCKYIISVTDTTQFSSNFIQALAARIAQELAMPITNNRNILNDMEKLYQAKLMAAASKDGMQGTTQVIQGRTLRQTRW